MIILILSVIAEKENMYKFKVGVARTMTRIVFFGIISER